MKLQTLKNQRMTNFVQKEVGLYILREVADLYNTVAHTEDANDDKMTAQESRNFALKTSEKTNSMFG